MPSPVSDLREWIALLEKEGELVRVTATVDPDLEITEIADRTVAAGGPALLFENVKGLLRESFAKYFGYIVLQLTYPRVTARKGEDWTEHLGRN